MSKISGFCTLEKNSFINKSRSKPNEKIPHTLLQKFVRKKRAQNFSQTILNSTVVGARKISDKFSDK